MVKKIEKKKKGKEYLEEKEAKMKAFWHSTSHVLADAVKRLWPDVKLGIGPAIAEGFYYDFDKKAPFVPEDLARIEKEMQKIISENAEFKRVFLERKKAERLLKNEPYKLDLLKEIPDKKISFYQHGKFIDLCAGPLISRTGQIKTFKLLKIAGAYWRGDVKKPMLQRIYGISFPSSQELDAYLKKLEEFEKRDHIKLGRQLDIFSVSPEIGAGLIIWHPKGSVIRAVIEDFWKSEHRKRGYSYLYSPHIGNLELWKKSGHWQFYRESMYSPMKIDNLEFEIKPMNCPYHIQVYKSKMRSYKELPIKYCELGTVYRYELAGTLHGLTRVRGFTQDDSHIFCTPEQIEEEVAKVFDLAMFMLRTFGFKEFKIDLSVRDPAKKEKYLGDDKIWKIAEHALENVLKNKKQSYKRAIGEAVFYGPKIDIKLLDALGREWQGPTIQLDFNFPEKFDLTYIGQDNKEHRVAMIHRTVLGSMERFVGCLIENYAGNFPLWLAPVQVKLLTLTDKSMNYAIQVEKKLKEAGLRIETDYNPSTVQLKIRNAEMEKVPYIIVVGEKEDKAKTLAVRSKAGVKFGVKVDEFIQEIKKEIEEKR